MDKSSREIAGEIICKMIECQALQFSKTADTNMESIKVVCEAFKIVYQTVKTADKKER